MTVAGSSSARGAHGPFVVAGHLCVDLTPALGAGGIAAPGQLISAGPLRISTGGAVPNVGSALSRLGHQVRLAARLGDDWLGRACIELLRPLGAQPGLCLAGDLPTGYSIVLAPPGEDRAFLHCTGANAAFVAADVADCILDGAVWMHLGYPPVLPAIAADGGGELAALFRRAAARGLRTSLDFCSLDPSAPPTDWEAVLGGCAESVTLFAPSIDEMRTVFGRPARPAGSVSDVPLLARRLLDLGFPVVAIKMGANGLYLASSASSSLLGGWGLGPAWTGLELLAPCFRSNFVNASGAGDCTIAGLISAMARGLGPAEALTVAVAAGASSTEAADASGGVRPLAELEARMQAGWERLGSSPPGDRCASRSGVRPVGAGDGPGILRAVIMGRATEPDLHGISPEEYRQNRTGQDRTGAHATPP